jgi:transcriptional regulator with XRE-family HTH domain
MVRSVFSAGYQQFRSLLIKERKRAGLTQARLATRLNRPQSFVAKYEQGERRIDVIEFLEIAEALRVNPESFVSSLRRRLNRHRPKSFTR